MNIFKDRCDLPRCINKAVAYIKIENRERERIAKHCSICQQELIDKSKVHYDKTRIIDLCDSKRCKHDWRVIAEIHAGYIVNGNMVNDKHIGSAEQCIKCEEYRNKIY